MTERLYYTDAYVREFDATVTRVDSRGGRALVYLDRTAFYPASGGQPFDVGVLNACPVVEVVDQDRDEIAHVVDAPVEMFSARQPIHGSIDWARRFDHMQQHTGQHMLSAAIDRRFGVGTVSFHLGSESSTIDLARELTRAELAEAEQDANRVVWEDREVSIRFVSAEDAAALPLRKESAREGVLRLIDIDGFDLSACGGTHVSRAGGIGIIAIGATERFKGGQRVEFFCGGRALARFGSMRDVIAGSIRALSVTPGELPAAIEKLQADARDRQKTIAAMQLDLARYRAEEFAASAELTPAGRLVARAIDADAQQIKSIASAITSQSGFVVVLASTSTPALVVVARSRDVRLMANDLVASLTARFGGRGGGKPDMAQAGGLDADGATIVDAARFAVSAQE